MANKPMNKYSTSLTIKEMQIRTAMGQNHLPSVRIATVKETRQKITNNNTVKGWESLCTVGGNVKIKNRIQMIQHSLLGIYLKN